MALNETLNYQEFEPAHQNLVKTVGNESDMGSETIYGLINQAANEIHSQLEYAENTMWASSKIADFDQKKTEFVAAVNTVIELLNAAGKVEANTAEAEQQMANNHAA